MAVHTHTNLSVPFSYCASERPTTQFIPQAQKDIPVLKQATVTGTVDNKNKN